MAARKTSPALKAFGSEVTRLREDAAVIRTELAKRMAVSRSYISQVETGHTRCRRDFAQRLDQALSTGNTITDLWDEFLQSATYPKTFADYPRAEASASLLRMYGETFVVGLLQTEEYARVLLQSQLALEGRLKRQQILKRNPPPRLIVVLAEVVLARDVGGPEVMHGQCRHLLEASHWENVALQIAPTAYYRGVSGAFSIATQPTGEELLNQEMSTGGITSSEPGDILHCVSAFADLQARSLSVNNSRDFIRKAMDRWTM
ncbi:helix-turn-helix domain-containing protein [Actinomadura algeriensis]|uniref:Transcriptional regulator with XRE-family HTH domain n=1 Tax=Actinomadura algeriensis TaxID=1679523 RepID=A0ABR9K4B5_9ACTN|nr:helix-turn-helix transcriptional regulator [Actinomadura algeriensis]MBE1537657.1 transcriptional regulator with XRE-family HTH domain [Actinomadura algeriensis]